MDTIDAPTLGTVRAVHPRRLAWLRDELDSWVAGGLLEQAQARAILGHYRPARHLGLGRLLLGLGAGFTGVGVIWLVAANLDQFPPLGRFAVVTAFWLGLVAAAYLLRTRRTRQGRHGSSPVLGALHGLAALVYGAVVLQAAQSLQVPAYEPSLVGFWALGALLYAYAVAGTAPLLVGMVTGVLWWVWQVSVATGGGVGTVLAFLLAGAGASAIAVLHDRLRPGALPGAFAAAWRESAALLVLVGLFVAALPHVGGGDLTPSVSVVTSVVVIVLLVLAAVVLGSGTARLEPVAAAALTLIGLGLVLWQPPGATVDRLSAADWLAAAAGIAAYALTAGLIAALGVVRDSGRLTWLALAALVVFTTVQAFAVFSLVITGAWLFVVLGLVFATSGFGFDRARRELESNLAGVAT